jgi:inner membrane transporter RhtA
MVIAALIVSPIGAPVAARALGDPIALLAGAGVGICSSVVPYVLDQLAMARLPRASYSLMLSLLPAVATVVGLVVLGQVPSLVDVVGVALVVAGVAVHREAAARAGDPRHRHSPDLGESRYAAGASTASGAAAGAAGSSGAGAGAG